MASACGTPAETHNEIKQPWWSHGGPWRTGGSLGMSAAPWRGPSGPDAALVGWGWGEVCGYTENPQALWHRGRARSHSTVILSSSAWWKHHGHIDSSMTRATMAWLQKRREGECFHSVLKCLKIPAVHRTKCFIPSLLETFWLIFEQ